MKRLIVLLMVCFCGVAAAQMPGIGYDQLLDPRMDLRNQDKMLSKVEALFIQEMFVKHLFQSTPILDFEDEEEDSILSNRESDQLMNTMYARELSRVLAEQNLLGLQDYYGY